MHISRREVLKLGAAMALAPAAVVTSEQWASAASLVAGEPPLPEADAFTVVVLPDTQHYSEKFPGQFLAQTEWIVANREQRKIACVLHLGDITNRNTPAEWENAVAAMSKLDGHTPYFMAVGNHDYSTGGSCRDRTTRLNEYFPLKKYRDLPTFGGVYDKEPESMVNSYHRFSAGGRDFLVIALEFGPRADVVRWANEVAVQHADREAILITHAYMYSDETRYDWHKYGAKQHWNPHTYGVAKASGGDVHDGEELWTKLVSQHENFILTLNGHVLNDGLGYTATQTPAGRDVHQMLVNFQMQPRGGDGWLRLLQFGGDGVTLQTYDYSPTLDQQNRSPANEFTMQLAPPPRA